MVLRERVGYFSMLATKIEEIVENLKRPVVLLGHSMGNRVIQYFTWMSMWGRRGEGERREGRGGGKREEGRGERGEGRGEG
jgi:hypothetical protein